MDLVRFSLDGRTATITMAAKHNVLGAQMIEGMVEAFDKAGNARCVILRALPGAKVWSAGHDIAELPEMRRDPLGGSEPMAALIRAIQERPAPVIALIEGGVWGAACELALSCDILVATPESTFALTPAKLGVPYTITGLPTFMNAMPIHMVKEMAFTAQPVSAGRAHGLGIVNHIAEPDAITPFCTGMARGIETLAPLSTAAMKKEIHALASQGKMAPHTYEQVQAARRAAYDSDDFKEGLLAFGERRVPDFKGK